MAVKRYEGNGRMSEVVVHKGVLYLSGQICITDNLDVAEQTTGTLNIIEGLLEKYGSDKRNILSATIYLKEIGLYDEMNKAWDAWVEDGYEPSRTCVEAKMAREDFLVEITVVAAIK